MKNKKITIYEVAKAAGVSLATVSRVINQSDLVKEKTANKVKEAISKLGYRPNAIAQGLALQKSTTIAFIVPDTSFTYTGKVINGLLDVARLYKYNVVLHTISEGINEMSSVIENIIVSRVDGVIIYNDKLTHDELEVLNDYQVPIVIIGNRMSGDDLASVFVDVKKACDELVSNYLAKGKDKIAILQDRKHHRSIVKLQEGASAAFERKGKSFNNYIEISSEYRTSYSFLSNYFKEHKDLELLICYRDSHALAAINAAKENNIKVPEQLEVVCIIDTKYNTMVRPQISSFTIPSYDLGAVAMRVMTKILNNDNNFDKEIELSYLYTARQSTK
ncbi:MAG: LacI family DNA-binding transcriptional regulator [Erysipelotrichaceae bacterium]